ncbi:MAG: methyltransferase [bacterium]
MLNHNYFINLSSGYQISSVIFTAIQLDIFTFLEKKSISAKTISCHLKIPNSSLKRFLDVLIFLNLLLFKNGKYSLTSISSKYLVKNSPFYMGNFIHHRFNLISDWQNLLVSLNTNKPITFTSKHQKQFSHRLNDYLLAMKDIAKIKSNFILKKIDLSKYNSLLELGSGLGEYSIAFNEKYPHLKITLFDLPKVIKKAKKYISKKYISLSSINFQSGNCLIDFLGKEKYDVIFVSNLIHIYSEKENQKIIKKCFTALKKHGIIIIHDFIKEINIYSFLFDLNMLLGTVNGKVYTKEEIKNLLKKSNFKKIKIDFIDKKSSAIFVGVKE